METCIRRNYWDCHTPVVMEGEPLGEGLGAALIVLQLCWICTMPPDISDRDGALGFRNESS